MRQLSYLFCFPKLRTSKSVSNNNDDDVEDDDETESKYVLCMFVARSSLLDRSFDLCEFRDDPEPLRDKIRSRRMKILLRKSYKTVSVVK